MYHRKKSTSGDIKDSGVSGGSKKKNLVGSLPPMEPQELEEINIEDLVTESLEQSDNKLEIFDERHIGNALEAYVQKQQAQAFTEVISDNLQKKQKKLIKQGPGNDNDEEEDEDKTRKRVKSDDRKYTDEAERENGDSNRAQQTKKKRKTAAPDSDEEDNQRQQKEHQEDSDAEEEPPAKRGRGQGRKPVAARTTGRANTKTRKQASKPIASSMDADIESDDAQDLKIKTKPKRTTKRRRMDDSDDDEVEEVTPPTSRARTSPRRAVASRSRVNYKMDSSDEEDDVVELDQDDEEDVLPPPKRGRSRATQATSATTRGKKSEAIKAGDSSQSQSRMSQSQLSFAPVAKSAKGAQKKKYADDDSDEDVAPSRSYELDDDWGTARTDTYKS